MKKISILLFLWNSSFAQTSHYISLAGNDANPGTQSLPWLTLTKVNTALLTANSGDKFLFNRGDTFYGKIVFAKSGSVGNQITLSSYGTGVKPVISGFQDVVPFTNLGGNLWQSTFTVSTLNSLNEVLIKGINTAMGRYPNTGYFPYQSFTLTSLTSTSIPSAVRNWTGAEIVSRKNNWIIDRDTIIAHSGNTVTRTSHSTYTGIANYGFFIQNNINTLDTVNEWYYNPSSNKITIYSLSMPTNVKVSSIDTLIYTKQFDNLKFDSLTFIGSNKATIVTPGSQNITIQNCSFDYTGQDGISGIQNFGVNSASGFIFQNNTVNHTNNNFWQTASEFTGLYIGHNSFKNTGLQVGMGGNGSNSSYGTDEVLQVKGANTIIEYNTFDSTGYIPVNHLANNIIIRFNKITNYMMVKQDGGGIYTWNGNSGATVFSGTKIYNNLILNSYGFTSLAGTTNTVLSSLVHGLYFDANTNGVEAYNNTVANVGYGGLYIYSGSSNLFIHNNTFYNGLVNQVLMINKFSNGNPTLHDTLRSNIFFSRLANQYTGRWQVRGTLSSFLSTQRFDSNYYARPIDDNVTLQSTDTASTVNYTLSTWKSASSQDTHSNKSPLAASDTSKIRFYYNDTTINKTFILGAVYEDVRGTKYSDSIILTPYTSAVLIYDTALASLPPVVDAGASQNITLPTNSVTLTGTASSPNMGGSISSTVWTKVSGPAATISTPFSLSTSVLGMHPGVYVFQLTATDNVGNTASDTTRVIVNDSTVIPPIANAGVDQIIDTTVTTLDGTGSHDTDGTIVSYAWSQLTGPNTATIVTPSGSTTVISGLITGVYTFHLVVTNNGGATDSDDVQITVTLPATSGILIKVRGNVLFIK